MLVMTVSLRYVCQRIMIVQVWLVFVRTIASSVWPGFSWKLAAAGFAKKSQKEPREAWRSQNVVYQAGPVVMTEDTDERRKADKARAFFG
jgi:hypothetical protein